MPALAPGLFLDPASIVRLGTPPFRIEVMTTIDGVGYEECRRNAVRFDMDGLSVPVISLSEGEQAGCWPTQ